MASSILPPCATVAAFGTLSDFVTPDPVCTVASPAHTVGPAPAGRLGGAPLHDHLAESEQAWKIGNEVGIYNGQSGS